MKKRGKGFVLLIALLFVALLLAGCDFLFGPKFIVTGKVLADQGDTGRSGIAGAKIEVGRSAIYSGSNGDFYGWFNIPSADLIQIKISRQGYQATHYNTSLQEDERTIDLGNVFLTPLVSNLAGAYGTIDVISGYHRQDSSNDSSQLPPDIKVVAGVREVPSFAEYEPGVVLIGFDPKEITIRMIDNHHKQAGTRLINRIEGLNVDVVSLKKGQTPEETIAFYENLPGVRYAELNYYAYALNSPGQVPNDQYFNYQWALKIIDMPLAWGICRDADDVLVAVLDTGMIIHEDLFPHPYGEWGNIRWDLGKDFADKDDQPFDTDPYTDENNPSHGAHVAGTIGALTDNEIGVAGAAWKVGIVPVRVLGEKGVGTYADIAEGIMYATDIGVDIINLSLGSSVGSRTLADACKYAYDKGVTLIAAAGNNNSPVFYPAAYDEVIAVAAVGPDGRRAPYSNYGPQIDVAAPGGYWPLDENLPISKVHDYLILSTSGYYYDLNNNHQEYVAMEGTSMAAPHVAGVAALLIANGTASTPADVRQALISSANRYSNPNVELGYGLINAYRALQGQSSHACFEVFAGKREGNTIYVYSDTDYVDYPAVNNYRLGAIDPGYYNVFCWLDRNDNGKIDREDLFGQSRTQLFTRGADKKVDLTVEDFGAYTLSEGPIEVIDRRDTAEKEDEKRE